MIIDGSKGHEKFIVLSKTINALRKMRVTRAITQLDYFSCVSIGWEAYGFYGWEEYE
jgi:hypothetical protein